MLCPIKTYASRSRLNRLIRVVYTFGREGSTFDRKSMKLTYKRETHTRDTRVGRSDTGACYIIGATDKQTGQLGLGTKGISRDQKLLIKICIISALIPTRQQL